MIYPWQTAQWQYVTQLIQMQRLPHAILLQGHVGLGKFEFANELARALLCKKNKPHDKGIKLACGECQSCLLLQANSHPDLHYIKAKSPEKSKSKNPIRRISIDSLRALYVTLNQTSQYSGYRIVIIDEAQKLTFSAANSLLKTLEEPGENVLIILISANAQQLVPTIRSRCQKMRFTVPEFDLALNWLMENNSNNESRTLCEQALHHAFGAPLDALKKLAQSEHYQCVCDAMLAKVSGEKSLNYATKLANFPKHQTLETMLIWVSDLSKLLLCGEQAIIINQVHRKKLQLIASKAKKNQLFKFHDLINFNLRHHSIALNEQLLWENMLLSWDNI